MWTDNRSDANGSIGEAERQKDAPPGRARKPRASRGASAAGRDDAARASRADKRPAARSSDDQQPGIERPRSQEGIERGVHGTWTISFNVIGRARGRPGRRLTGRSQARQKSTRAVISAGVDLLAVGRHVAAARRAVADLVDELVAA